MILDAQLTELTADQKDQICKILTVGADRDTAAGVVKCLVVDIGRSIAADPQFARDVRHAEATAELSHMQHVLKATNDGKYWRASVWWLERRSPERFGRRSAGAITPQQFQEAIVLWNDVLQQKFSADDDQDRVTECIDKLYASMEQLLDARCTNTLLKRFPPLTRIAHKSTAIVDDPEKTDHDERSPESANP